MVGNPYPSELSFAAFRSANSSLISNKAWFYCSTTANTGDVYTVYNGSQLINDFLPAANKVGTSGNYTDIVVSSGESFFVESTASGSVNFTESQKSTVTANGNGVFSRQAAPWTNYIRVHLMKDADSLQPMDEIIIRFKNDNQVSNSQYGILDAYSLNSVTSSIASLKAEGRMAIQTRRLDFVGKDTVQIAANAAAGNYRLTFTEYEQFTKAAYIYLIDNYLHTVTNVKQQISGYTFSITADTASQGSRRFAVVFSTKPIKTTSAAAVQYAKVSTDDSLNNTAANVQFGLYPNPVHNALHISVQLQEYMNYQLKIMSVTGAVIMVKEGTVKGGTINLPTARLTQGTYIAHLYFTNGTHYSQKFVKQ